jgi:hypothetical protein
MNNSFFIAKVMGIYFIITGLFSFIQYQAIDNIIRSTIHQPGIFLVMAIVTLILGLLLVVSHNLWTKDWHLIITIISWVILISGICRLFFINYAINIGNWWLGHKPYMLLFSILFFLIGLFLTYKGFFTKPQKI